MISKMGHNEDQAIILVQCKPRVPWLFIRNASQESQSIAKKLVLETFVLKYSSPK